MRYGPACPSRRCCLELFSCRPPSCQASLATGSSGIDIPWRQRMSNNQSPSGAWPQLLDAVCRSPENPRLASRARAAGLSSCLTDPLLPQVMRMSLPLLQQFWSNGITTRLKGQDVTRAVTQAIEKLQGACASLPSSLHRDTSRPCAALRCTALLTCRIPALNFARRF